MHNRTPDNESYSCMTISAAVRIESFDFCDYGDPKAEDSILISIHCITQDGGEITKIKLFQVVENVQELRAKKESWKIGEAYYIKNQRFILIGGEILLSSTPELLPFKGNKVAFKDSLDKFLLPELPKICWSYDKCPQGIKGRVTGFNIVETKGGKPMANIQLSTEIGAIEGLMFPEEFKQYRQLLDDGDELLFFGVFQNLEDAEDNTTRMLVKSIGLQPIAKLFEINDKAGVTVCGIVNEVKLLNTRKGDRMAFITVEDSTGEVEIVVFPETYSACAELLGTCEEPLFFIGQVDVGEDSTKILADKIVKYRG